MSTSTAAPLRGRKIRAVLAGGLVLGVGAAVTLAAWTDDEWATGNFAAGTFSIEGSPTGAEGTFDDHTTSDGAALLSFEVGADNLSPESVVAAPFVMRTTADTTYAATVSLASATSTADLTGDLTYGIIQVDSAAACTAGATGTVIVPAGTAFDVAPTGATDITLAAAPAGTAGAATTLCLQVTAGSTLAQGDTGTATWEFSAVSVE